MARNKTSDRSGAGKTAAPRATRGKGARAATATARPGGDEARDDMDSPDWDEVTDELSPIPDFDGMIGKPAANQGSDPMTRRRIEMLREERMLAKALSDVFDQ